jgi:hypothetical protein
MNFHLCQAIAELVEHDYFNSLADRLTSKIVQYDILKRRNNSNDLNLLNELYAQLNEMGIELECKREESFSTAVFSFYTKIIKFHCEKSIQLLPAFNHALFFCTKPKILNYLFTRGLFISVNFNNVLNDYLFESLQELDDYSHAYKTISSVSIILYRVCTKQIRQDIVSHINETLCNFIMEEDYNKKTRVKGLNLLVKSFILNGILNLNELKAFFGKKSIDYNELSDDFNYNNNNNNNDDDNEIKLETKLKLNTQEFYGYFPLSLKNLNRIVIKNAMNNLYFKSNVNLLSIPDGIKKFILFDDEINEILD